MRKHRQLYGMMMRPCSRTEKENEKVIFSSDYASKKDFRKLYENHIAGMQILAESAKIYILKNWKKVKDWSDIDISIVDNTGKETRYYKYVERANLKRKREMKSKGHFVRFLERMDKEDKKNHNPVKKISNVVLDTSDGDFSLDINGKPHLWIDDESVIILADYIEWKLNKKINKKIKP